MRHPLPVICALALAAIVGSACSTASYNSDFDPEIAYSEYRTWQWLEDYDASMRQDRGVDQLVERRFKIAIENQLEAKGYSIATSGTPDFLMNFLLQT